MGLDMWLETKDKREVMYWRKVKQIHGWFMRLCGYDEDKLNEGFKVTRQELLFLIEDIKSVLNSEELAEDILPTTSGFFFGSYEYDEGYFNDLVDTLKTLEAELKNHPQIKSYIYSASW